MNAVQKAEFLEQSKAHFATDMLIQGTYSRGDAENFKGCSVGCHLYHIKSKWSPEQIHTNSRHAIVSGYYGYPEWLALLQDTIFEGLPNGESAEWHVQLAETLTALPNEYDWPAALHRVHIAILRVIDSAQAQAVVQQVIDLHERAIRGEQVADKLWSAAERAAERAVRRAAINATQSMTMNATWCAVWSAAWRTRGAIRNIAENAAGRTAKNTTYQKIRDGVLAALAK